MVRGSTLAVLVILLCVSNIAAINPKNGVNGAMDSSTYDFIVVGAGGVGSIVASRLAKETTKSILLLEGGDIGTGQRDIGGTEFSAMRFKHDSSGNLVVDKSLTIYDVFQQFDFIRLARVALNNSWPINATGAYSPQARVIGGSMATNGLGWICPANHEIDAWNVPGFTGTGMRTYLKKVENATQTGYGAATQRGTSGPINVRFGTFTPLEQTNFKNAALAAGYAMQGDNNAPESPPGIYQAQFNVRDGIRSSSSVEYLVEQLDGCSNLYFRPGSIVTKVLITTNHGVKTATGVQYVDTKTGATYQATARLEVILATAEMQTPKILFYSGIGPSSKLTPFGITVQVDNAMIGQKIRNMQRATMYFNSSSQQPPNLFVMPTAMNEYATNGTGVMDAPGIYYMYGNSTPTTPNDLFMYVGFAPAAITVTPYQSYIGVTALLNVNDYANGTISLTSSNPLAPINWVANNLLLDSDATRLARGILETRRIVSHWPGGPLPEIAPGANVTSLTDLKAFVRSVVNTPGHYYGSVPMGTDAKYPADERMRIKGVAHLRVVGPQVIPGPVRNGMQCLATMLAEKGTDLIKADNGL